MVDPDATITRSNYKDDLFKFLNKKEKDLLSIRTSHNFLEELTIDGYFWLQRYLDLYQEVISSLEKEERTQLLDFLKHDQKKTELIKDKFD